MKKEELVVLVDAENNVIGTAPKATVHTADTPLHRAFSCFVFRSNGNMVLQQRAGVKVTWPLIWSNACCGHPLPDETNVHAVSRRLRFELGLTVPENEIHEVLPNFQYKATLHGVMENEICPVFVVFSDAEMNPNEAEVETTKELPWNNFIAQLLDPNDAQHDGLSVWCRQEAALLATSETFQSLWQLHINDPQTA